MAYEYSAEGNGQNTAVICPQFISLVSPKVPARVDQHVGSARCYPSQWKYVQRAETISIDERVRLASKFGDEVLLTAGENLMCSLSQHNSMTRKIAFDAKSLEQFSFILSHKLRAPIAKALGLAQLLENNLISDEEREKCQRYLCASVREIDDEIKALNLVLREHAEGSSKVAGS